MKTSKSSLLLPILAIIFSFTLSGCYTQLAFVDDEDNSTIEPSPIIIYQPEILPVYVPVYDPLTPIYNPLPSAVSSQPIKQSQSQIRDTGYQRPSQSNNTQTTSSGSNIRTSGSRHGG